MSSKELETATEAIGKLFCGWPQAPSDCEPFIAAYLDVLKDEVLSDILAAIERLRKGEAPDVDPAFIPTGAQVYREVRKHREVREMAAKSAARKVVPLLPTGHFQNRRH